LEGKTTLQGLFHPHWSGDFNALLTQMIFKEIAFLDFYFSIDFP